MRNPDSQSLTPDLSATTAASRRVQIFFLLSALSLPACGKPGDVKSVPDAQVPDGVASAMSVAYKEFEKGESRARFAADFSKRLEITKGSDHFFYPMNYQWKLEEALKQAGQGGEVPDTVFRQMNEAVLAQGLQRLFGAWAHEALPKKNPPLYRGPYVQELYRHYRSLRYLEVLPERPEKRGAGDLDKLIGGWFDRDQKAWQLTAHSPFFGIQRDPGTAGPLDKPFMPLKERLTREMTEQCPNRLTEDFKNYYMAKIQSAVLDMILPAMYHQAILERLKRANLNGVNSTFDEAMFESELKKAFGERAQYFGQYGVGYAPSVTDRRIMEIVSAKFREMGRLEHPLQVYEVSK